ncbi:MAG: hypothetical protein RLO50_09515 [Azospirillaceae bacterium]
MHGPGLRRLLVIGFAGLASAIVVADAVSRSGGPTLRDLGFDDMTRAPTARPESGDQLRPYDPLRLPTAAPEDRPVIPPSPGAQADRLSISRTDPVAEHPAALVFGTINAGDLQVIERFLDANPDIALLTLDSPGGLVQEALAIADWLRGRELATAVGADAVCLSACPIILAAGHARLVDADAWVGLHQAALLDNPLIPLDIDRATQDVQRINAAVMARLTDWGIDAAIWRHALSTPPAEMYVLTVEELTDSAYATEVL